MNLQRDPVTQSVISAEEQERDKRNWDARTTEFVGRCNPGDALALCQALYQFLDGESRGQLGRRPTMPLCDHAPDSYLADHALLTSAIVYCLGHDRPDIHLLRLAALSHEFSAESRAILQQKITPSKEQDVMLLDRAWRMLQDQTVALKSALQTDDSLSAFTDAVAADDAGLMLLWYAHLAASQPLFNHKLTLPDHTTLAVIRTGADFDRHPLRAYKPKIGLVYGGATKVKQYVLESAKLPEIRGVSIFLDRLNLDFSRKLFDHAPECIIYAAGGDLLALTPCDNAVNKANAIEAAYTQATLSAQSVAAATVVSLLELQYGLAPQSYWADAYHRECTSGNTAKTALLRSYYGNPADRHEAGWTDEMLFHLRKCFGEVAGSVAVLRLKRREGNLAGDEADTAARAVLHFETLPHGQFCSSCDRRTAVVRIPDLEDDLCESCLRKRWIGWRTRYGNVNAEGKAELVRTIHRTEEAMKGATDWRPEHFEQAVSAHSFKAWHLAFEAYLDQALGDEGLSTDLPADIATLRTAYLATVQGVAWDSRTPIDGPPVAYPGIWPAYTFTEIGQAADPDGYIGIVYADGNNVGALIERIRTPAEYRQFAQRLFHANQRAVFEALARHLRPVVVQDDKEQAVLIHPFEIISIGGDDLFLVVPAEKALPIALDISNTLERLFATDGTLKQGAIAGVGQVESYAQVATKAQRLHKAALTHGDAATDTASQRLIDLPGAPRISMATGVVLAAHTTPFYFLTEIVEELLKSAKQKAKHQKGKGDYGSTVDFMALKSVAMITTRVDSFRQIALTERKAPDILHLTARPYTTTEAAALVDAIKMLKVADFPRSQLYQLRELLPQGRFATSLGYLYFTSRLKREWTAVIRHNLDDRWCHPTSEPAPWMRQEGNSWETVLGDLVELYDFVSKPDKVAERSADALLTAPSAQPQLEFNGEVSNG
jgi:CRISPR-associated protein Cmr2